MSLNIFWVAPQSSLYSQFTLFRHHCHSVPWRLSLSPVHSFHILLQYWCLHYTGPQFISHCCPAMLQRIHFNIHEQSFLFLFPFSQGCIEVQWNAHQVKTGFYERKKRYIINGPSSFTLNPTLTLFPAYLDSFILWQLRWICMFKFQLGWLTMSHPAKPSRVAFVSFLALPDPDGIEQQQQSSAGREEKHGTRKTNRCGKGIPQIPPGRQREGRTVRNVDIKKRRSKQRKKVIQRISAHMFESIKTFGRYDDSWEGNHCTFTAPLSVMAPI